MELTHYAPDWFRRHPEARDPLIGTIHIEHLGEMEFREIDGRVEPTGFGEQAYLWVRSNPLLIDSAIRAAKKYRPSKLQVVVPERPGIHGQMQQKWWGVGVIGTRGYENDERIHGFDIPGFGFASYLGNYWSIYSGIGKWNIDQHMKQVNLMTYLANVLMNAEVARIRPL